MDTQEILDRVQSGDCGYSWGEVTSEHNGHVARFYVFEDALKLDGVRVNVSAALEQRIADLLDASLLTAKLADLVWEQSAIQVGPKPQTVVNGVVPSSYASTVKHSTAIDKEIAGRTGMVQSVGKHWILTNKIAANGLAANYGWHFTGATYQGMRGEVSVTGNGRVLQGIGTRHNSAHADYSQTCVLVHSDCMLDDMQVRLSDLLSSPEYWPLVSHEGIIKVLRQPGV